MADVDDGAERRRALFAVSDGVLGAAVLLVIGVYGGAWLDTKLNTAPWLSVGLSLLGGGLGLARLVMKANSLNTMTNTSVSSTSSDSSAKKPAAANNQTEVKKHRMPYDGFEDD